MDQLFESFQDYLDAFIVSIPQILTGIFVIILFSLIGLGAGRSLKRLLARTSVSTKRTETLRRITRWVFYTIGIVVSLNIMGLTKAASGILAAGGVLTVVLGFAFREIGENLLAGLFMSFSRSFDVGDLIESNGITGIVRQINIRDVHVRAADGIDIFIPSAMIFKNPLNNYTRDGLRRGHFRIGIDFRSDSAKARELILAEVNAVNGILKEPPANVQIANFTASYIELEIFFWINTFAEELLLKDIQTQVMESTKEVLLANGFTVSSEVTTAIDIVKN